MSAKHHLRIRQKYAHFSIFFNKILPKRVRNLKTDFDQCLKCTTAPKCWSKNTTQGVVHLPLCRDFPAPPIFLPKNSWLYKNVSLCWKWQRAIDNGCSPLFFWRQFDLILKMYPNQWEAFVYSLLGLNLFSLIWLKF